MMNHLMQRWSVHGVRLTIQLESERMVTEKALKLLVALTQAVEAESPTPVESLHRGGVAVSPEVSAQGLASARAALTNGRRA